ncbi:MAG: peptidoglycan-binding protein [Candidatus Actinomarina sp.]
MLRGGLKISFDFSTFVDNLAKDEVEDLKSRLNYVGYSTNDDINELKAVVGVFIEDNSFGDINNKEDFWSELINFGYKLGDRILSFNNKTLYGSDVEELQELLSRMGFYSEPINGKYSRSVVEGVTKFQENRGITIDGVVGHNTVYEIKKLIRPGRDISLNEAIKSISPGLDTGIIGFNICFDIPNIGSYKQQIKFYDEVKKTSLEKGVISVFASEVNEELDINNKIEYINNLQPTLFISFNPEVNDSINYFKGTFSESLLGRKLAENLASSLQVRSIGKSSNILKQTKSVGIIINGKIYQKINIELIIESVVDTLNKQFEN